jgi:hypothetical protein
VVIRKQSRTACDVTFSATSDSRELGISLHWSFERLDQTDLVVTFLEGSLVHPVEGPAPAGLVKEVEHGVERGTGSF